MSEVKSKVIRKYTSGPFVFEEREEGDFLVTYCARLGSRDDLEELDRVWLWEALRLQLIGRTIVGVEKCYFVDGRAQRGTKLILDDGTEIMASDSEKCFTISGLEVNGVLVDRG